MALGLGSGTDFPSGRRGEGCTPLAEGMGTVLDAGAGRGRARRRAGRAATDAPPSNPGHDRRPLPTRCRPYPRRARWLERPRRRKPYRRAVRESRGRTLCRPLPRAYGGPSLAAAVRGTDGTRDQDRAIRRRRYGSPAALCRPHQHGIRRRHHGRPGPARRPARRLLDPGPHGGRAARRPRQGEQGGCGGARRVPRGGRAPAGRVHPAECELRRHPPGRHLLLDGRHRHRPHLQRVRRTQPRPRPGPERRPLSEGLCRRLRASSGLRAAVPRRPQTLRGLPGAHRRRLRPAGVLRPG